MDKKDSTIIEQYLSKELSKEETKVFKERIQRDPELRMKFELRKVVTVVLENL